MDKATLQRFYNDKVSFWEFKGWWEHPKIFFIAPPWLDNKRDVSHIPAGYYNVIKHESKPNVYRILNVPERSGIEIHTGNYACPVMVGKELHQSESKGCFMTGFEYDLKTPMIRKSVKAMEYLQDNIKGNWALEVRTMLPPEVI